MTLRNTHSILTKLSLNSKADVFHSCLKTGLTLFHDTMASCKHFTGVVRYQANSVVVS